MRPVVRGQENPRNDRPPAVVRLTHAVLEPEQSGGGMWRSTYSGRGSGLILRGGVRPHDTIIFEGKGVALDQTRTEKSAPFSQTGLCEGMVIPVSFDRLQYVWGDDPDGNVVELDVVSDDASRVIAVAPGGQGMAFCRDLKRGEVGTLGTSAVTLWNDNTQASTVGGVGRRWFEGASQKYITRLVAHFTASSQFDIGLFGFTEDWTENLVAKFTSSSVSFGGSSGHALFVDTPLPLEGFVLKAQKSSAGTINLKYSLSAGSGIG